jgi:hypothetical protein
MVPRHHLAFGVVATAVDPRTYIARPATAAHFGAYPLTAASRNLALPVECRQPSRDSRTGANFNPRRTGLYEL